MVYGVLLFELKLLLLGLLIIKFNDYGLIFFLIDFLIVYDLVVFFF